MSGTANISSSFVIKAAQDSAAAETLSIANPGRSFTIEQIQVNWLALEANISDSQIQVKKASADGATVVDLFTAAAGVSANRQSVAVQSSDAVQCVNWLKPQQNNSFSSTENVRLTLAGAATQVEVILYCIGNPSQALTVTVI